MTDYVLCIGNATNSASLMLGKVYRTLPDAEAEGTRCFVRTAGERQG